MRESTPDEIICLISKEGIVDIKKSSSTIATIIAYIKISWNKTEDKLLSKTDAYADHVNTSWILDAFSSRY